MFQACSLGKCYNIRTTTSRRLEEIKVSFAKHGVEIASHPHTTGIVQPASLKGTLFQLLFWISIIMQISGWNDAKSIYLIDLGLVRQVHILPKVILFDVCLMWWGNPAKLSDLLSLWLYWPIHWNYSSNAFNITQDITTILPDEAFKYALLFLFLFWACQKVLQKFVFERLNLAQSLWPGFFLYFQSL